VATVCLANQYGARSLWNNFASSTTTLTNIFPNFGGSNNGLAKFDYAISTHHTLNGSFYHGKFEETAASNAIAFTEPWWEEVQGVTSQC
jgi:hypothetical protein